MQIGGWIIVLIVLAAGYLIACIFFPFARCIGCEGSGRKSTSSGKAWRDCRWCKGSGKRLRLGRHVINHMRETRRKSS